MLNSKEEITEYIKNICKSEVTKEYNIDKVGTVDMYIPEKQIAIIIKNTIESNWVYKTKNKTNTHIWVWMAKWWKARKDKKILGRYTKR